MAKILIIDDDERLTTLLSEYLPRFAFDVTVAHDPDAGLRLLREGRPDFVALDVMLPGRDGFQVCREIRASSWVPIIMLTARGETNDRIVGLELGADDYMPKPFDPRELVARIHSVLRRAQPPEAAATRLCSGELVVDLQRAAARLGERDLGLSGTEFEILALLMRAAGETVSRERIAVDVRGIEWNSLDRTIDVLVSRIRQKLGEDSRRPKYIKTMWGEGYRFIESVSHD